MKTLQFMRVGLALAVLALTSPVSLARSEVTLGTAGPLIAIRTVVICSWN